MALQRKITGRRAGALMIMAALLFAFQAREAFATSTWLSSIPCRVPTSIAVDAQGNLYVTEARNQNMLRVYDRRGALLRSMPTKNNPAGVAVDAQGKIYIVSQGNKSVDVYNNDFTYSFSLGIGQGEFISPHSVAVSSSGAVYVSDAKDNKIKIYNSNGTFSSSFGGWGSANGQFNTPLGIAINNATSELYVIDWGIYASANGPSAGARVQVFDLQGGFKRSWGQYGSGPGLLMRPTDIALDRDGRVYITDGFQGVAEVFDGYGVYAETIFDPAHPTRTPIAIAVGRDNRAFIASSNVGQIEVFGMTGYTTLDTSPASLAFTAVQGAGNPAAQQLSIINTGSGTLNWTAAADTGWIVLTPVGSTALTVGINAAGFAPGSYSGTVTITADTGAVATVPVTLTIQVPPPVLAVTPNTMQFSVMQNGAPPAGQTIDIRNLGGGAMTWTASSSQSWLTLSAVSGAAPSQILATIGNTNLPAGTQTAVVTVTAPGAQASPAVVNVTATVSDTGTLTVTTNLTQAQFTITSPGGATTNASGTLWNNTNAAPGNYTVAFQHAAGGYITPSKQTAKVATGKQTTIDATYAKKPSLNHMVVVSGNDNNKTVTVFTTAGEAVSTFAPFTRASAAAQAAVGDLDGSGVDKIVVSDGNGTVKVFDLMGAELASVSLPTGSSISGIAIGDVDNDGVADVLVGSLVKGMKTPNLRQILQYDMTNGKLGLKATLASEEGNDMFNLAIGDINGDLANEVVVADRTGVRAYSLSNGALSPLWSTQGAFKSTPLVTTGDIDDDGAAEILLSTPGVIQALRGTGEPTALQIAVPKLAAVACGDVNGDGADEIAVASTTASPSVQLYKGDGSAFGAPIMLSIKNATPGSGVGVSLGR